MDAYEYISATPRFSRPLVHGSIDDEFITSEPHCAIYANAVWKLKATPEFRDRVFYACANELYDSGEGRKLVQAVIDASRAIGEEIPTKLLDCSTANNLEKMTGTFLPGSLL